MSFDEQKDKILEQKTQEIEETIPGKIDPFKGKTLHPSLDIKDKVLIYGFTFISKEKKRKNFFLISDDKKCVLNQDETFKLGEKEFFIDVKGKKLADIEERWSYNDLTDFIKDYNQGKTKNLVNSESFFNKIKEKIKKYSELRKEPDYSLLAVWIIITYVFPIFSSIPFLHFKGVKGGGKSQVLNLLNQVCFNARKTRPSMPALVDTVYSLKGTSLIDQADFLKRKGYKDLVDILADSYKRGGGKRAIIQFDEKKRRSILEPDAYGPKAFASIGELAEDLKDRCILIPLIKSRRNFFEPDNEDEDWKEIRGECYKFAIQNFGLIKLSHEALSIHYRQNPEIFGRMLDIWLPIETMLKVCAPKEIESVKNRFSQLYGYTEYEPNDLEKAIIQIVNSSFKPDQTRILLTPKKILKEIDEEVWLNPNFTPHQKKIKVGIIVKKFNLSTEKKRTSTGRTYLFEKENVSDVASQYLICKKPI